MTTHQHFKRLVRARMAKTGESYSTARRHIIREPAGPGPSAPRFQHFPGNTPGPTALRTLLAHAGVRAPHTKAPFSEAMVFGIAGGIGAGVFTFHYPKEHFSSFFVAGRHLWHDHTAWASAATERMGVKAVIKESSGTKPAEKQLRELLQGGRPAMMWVTMRGLMYHLATVYAIDDAAGAAWVGDLGDEPIPVPLAALAEARARVKKDKHRLLALEPSRQIPDLARLVRGGIAACATGLAKARTKNFTLEAFATWAEKLAGSNAADAWDKLFPGPALYQGLRSITEYIEYNGTGGGLSRPLFAEFLEESAEALGDPRLGALAGRYAALGREWSGLADAALPESYPEFRQARELLARRAEISTADAETLGPGLESCAKAMQESAARMRETFPLGAAESTGLRRELQQRVRALVEGERAGLEELRRYAER